MHPTSFAGRLTVLIYDVDANGANSGSLGAIGPFPHVSDAKMLKVSVSILCDESPASPPVIDRYLKPG